MPLSNAVQDQCDAEPKRWHAIRFDRGGRLFGSALSLSWPHLEHAVQDQRDAERLDVVGRDVELRTAPRRK